MLPKWNSLREESKRQNGMHWRRQAEEIVSERRQKKMFQYRGTEMYESDTNGELIHDM